MMMVTMLIVTMMMLKMKMLSDNNDDGVTIGDIEDYDDDMFLTSRPSRP